MRKAYNRIELDPGDKFNMLTVIGFHGKSREGKKGRCLWLCKCECGNETIVSISNLRNGKTKSCGCLAIKTIIKNSITHGLSKHPLYNVWSTIKARCYNPNDHAYKWYGNRGIKLCKEWWKFKLFYDWAMTSGYKEGLTIDRVDNDGDYSPKNCRWATPEEQANNRKSNHFVIYRNTRLTIADWSKESGVSQVAIWKRLKRGWDIEDALFKPLGPA